MSRDMSRDGHVTFNTFSPNQDVLVIYCIIMAIDVIRGVWGSLDFLIRSFVTTVGRVSLGGPSVSVGISSRNLNLPMPLGFN